jgi:PAS domain S-box-containing protein
MLADGALDPYVLGRIVILQGTLEEASGEEALGRTLCRGLLRIPGIENCALCLSGTVVASSAPEQHDLTARFCRDGCRNERFDTERRADCISLRSAGFARIALATQRRTYGGLLIAISDEEQYSVYEPYVNNTASRVALNLEIGTQAAELGERSENLSRLVRARTLEIEEGKARLELAIQGADLGTWDWNVASGQVAYSERCAGMLGYTVKEVEPSVRSWERLVHADDLPRMTEAIEAHLAGKTAFYQNEHRRRHSSGRWVWVLDRGKVVEHDSAGRPVRMCGTHLDITDRKKAEQALQSSEERLRLALESGAMGIWDWNAVTDEMAWSESHYKLFGLDPRQFGGTREGFNKWVHPEDLPGIDAEVARCRENHSPYQHEFRIVRPDRSVRWMAARGTFSYDASGTPVRMLGVVWDITERRRVDAERIRLTAAIEHAGESFIIVDRQGVIEYVNPAFERTTGYRSPEVVGSRWDILSGGREQQPLYDDIQAILRAGRTWSGRTPAKRRDGTSIVTACTVSPVLGQDGKLEHVAVVYRDITDHLRMEEQLRQAQKIESVGRLAAGVAHDFNNMLTPILGYTEILLAGMHPADVRYAQLQEIRKAAESSRDLTRQLVAFSRKQVLQVKTVDLRTVVSGIEQLLRRTVRKNVALTTRLSFGPCPVAVDVGQIEQVLMNLAVNAQDAMPAGGELIIEVAPVELDEAFCAAHHDVKPGRYGSLTVSDTGCGMDEETRQHAFEPFFSTKSDHGTGLGLATVHGVVKQHAGSIWIESERGKGARFSIYLPAAGPEVERPRDQPATRLAWRGTETILLVEDNDMVRKLTQSLLQMQGYRVLSVASGAEALRAAGAGGAAEAGGAKEAGGAAEAGPAKVDLLLTDVVMPDMSGRDLSVKLRETSPKLKVLFMSGYSDDAIEQHGMLEADTDFIQKPFSVDGLVSRVREVLDRTV